MVGIWRLMVIVTVQTLILVGMVAWRQWILFTGTPVVLATQPVDPRSLFQGDYVALAYPAARFKISSDEDKLYRRGRKAWAVLMPGAGQGLDGGVPPVWGIASLHTAWPEAVPEGGVVLRGKVQRLEADCGRQRTSPCSYTVVLSYGIESYFIPETSGHKPPPFRSGAAVSVKVAVSRFGTSAIAGIMIDGQSVYEE